MRYIELPDIYIVSLNLLPCTNIFKDYRTRNLKQIEVFKGTVQVFWDT
jgi:hypothetical protein